MTNNFTLLNKQLVLTKIKNEKTAAQIVGNIVEIHAA